MGVKPPLPAGKPSVCNIYAAPSQISAHSSTKVMNRQIDRQIDRQVDKQIDR